jgi:hypothetical protein
VVSALLVLRGISGVWHSSAEAVVMLRGETYQVTRFRAQDVARMR